MYRVYYNTSKEAPHVCSVDQGNISTEIVVQGVRLEGISGFGKYNPDAQFPEPKFWIELPSASMELVGATAVFFDKGLINGKQPRN